MKGCMHFRSKLVHEGSCEEHYLRVYKQVAPIAVYTVGSITIWESRNALPFRELLIVNYLLRNCACSA